MPKLKTQKKQPLTVEEYLKEYDYKTLQGALASVQSSFAWELLKSYFKYKQRVYEVVGLDLTGHTGQVQEAARASGYAQGMEDAADKVIPEFIDIVMGKSGVVEDVRPTEDRFEGVNS